MSMTSRHISDGRHTRAFTLVEVTVVMTVIGVLAAISLPRYAGFETHRRLKLVANKIVADLAYARHLARLTGTDQEVSFDVGGDSYQLVGAQDLDQPRRNYLVDLGTEPYVTQITSANLGNDTNIIFNLYGLPDTGGVIVVQRGKHGLSIAIDDESGVTTVTEIQIVIQEPIL